MHTSLKLKMAAAVVTLGICGGGVAQAEMILNGDFQSQSFAQNKNTKLTFTDWSGAGNHQGDEKSGEARLPGPAGNQAPRLNGGADVGGTDSAEPYIFQNINHQWSAGDVFELSFNAIEVAWRSGGTGDSLLVELLEQDGTLLWSNDYNLNGTHSGDPLDSWPTGATFTESIEASTFGGLAGASEGNLLQLKFTAGGIIWLDDVSMTVPEPASLALLGLGGLAMLVRPRQRTQR